MTGNCWRCGGERWVCEKHGTRPFLHDDCHGAGEPCPECNDGHVPLNPPGFVVLQEIEAPHTPGGTE